MKIIFLFFISTLALTSCNPDDFSPTKPTPGYFGLSQLRQPASGRSASITESSTGFFLGDIHASREFSFILTNKGETTITDISITSNHPAFEVSPKNITSLAPGTLNSDIIPIILMSVNHGLRLNGVGYTDLLPMGLNEAVITITGKTISDGVATDVQSDFTFSVDSKVMAIEASDSEGIIDLTNPYGFPSGVPQAGGMNVPAYYTTGGLITITNIGNVPILIDGYTMTDASPSMSAIIQPGEFSQFQQPASNNGDCGGDFCPLLFSVYGYGPISDPNTLRLNDAGKAFFYL